MKPLLALILAALVAACAEGRPQLPVASAPLPQAYTCAQQRQAGAEFRALPADSMLRVLIDDYGLLRAQLRALHKLPEPTPCPPPSS